MQKKKKKIIKINFEKNKKIEKKIKKKKKKNDQTNLVKYFI